MIAYPDIRWTLIWLTGVAVIVIWNGLFLNAPDRTLVITAFLQSLMISAGGVLSASAIAWCWMNAGEWAERRRNMGLSAVIRIAYDSIRSAPQIIGLLIGYAALTLLIRSETLREPLWIMAWMAACFAVVSAPELTELFQERITHFKKKDFFPAMRVCGFSEFRIINRDILWFNGRALFLQKCVSLFGVVLFLQCSIDFIISVGLTNDISSANFPSTLGSVLAKMNSKQDILAVGLSFSDPASIPSLLTDHLMGISTAALLVWTLICFFQIAHELTRRARL